MSQAAHASAAPSAVGGPAGRIDGRAPVAMSGIRSILAGCALRAFSSGLTLSASHAADGRRTRSGMRSDSVCSPRRCDRELLLSIEPFWA
jgi:hypothetical protein